MPSKLIKQGSKFHCIVDYSYIWDLHPMSNQAGPDLVQSTNTLTVTREVVNISEKHFRLGGMAASEWTHSIRAVRDTLVAD